MARGSPYCVSSGGHMLIYGTILSYNLQSNAASSILDLMGSICCAYNVVMFGIHLINLFKCLPLYFQTSLQENANKNPRFGHQQR